MLIGLVAAGLAGWMVWSGRAAPARRLARVLPTSTDPADTSRPGPGRWCGERSAHQIAALILALASVLLVPMPWSLVVAATSVVALPRLLDRLESRAQRRRRRDREDATPLALDLLASCWTAGVPVQRGLDVVAASIGGPLSEDLRQVVARLELGSTASAAWNGITFDGPARDAVRILIDASESGIAPAGALRRAADMAREQRRRRGEAAARTVAVRVTAPLGLCFLPAFVLLGIAPAVVGALLPAVS